VIVPPEPVSENVAICARYINLQTRVDDLENTYRKACAKVWTPEEKKALDDIYKAHLYRLQNPPTPRPKGEYAKSD
jgi:hypothetical protein